MIGAHVAKRCRNAALRCHRVAAGGENLGNARGFQTGFGNAHCGTQAGTAGAHDNGVIHMIDDLIGFRHVDFPSRLQAAPSATLSTENSAIAARAQV